MNIFTVKIYNEDKSNFYQISNDGDIIWLTNSHGQSVGLEGYELYHAFDQYFKENIF